MIDLPPPFRPATPADAPALVDFVDSAGEGLASHIWARNLQPGETVAGAGRRRALREEGSFSYRNAIVAEVGGEVVAGLIGYALPDEPEEIGPDYPPMFVPLQALENMACGTWYINVLAAYPAHRGQGYGTRMIDIAQRLSEAAGRKGLSLIVPDANHGARRLYARAGFREVAARAMVKEDWANPGTDWLLLLRD
jgi:ribosomal protein S18 acetylase RimI-like enzyme